MPWHKPHFCARLQAAVPVPRRRAALSYLHIVLLRQPGYTGRNPCSAERYPPAGQGMGDIPDHDVP